MANIIQWQAINLSKENFPDLSKSENFNALNNDMFAS